MASSIGSEPEPPPSVFNVIPGGSLILHLPGSGLLLRGENVVRGVVATGLKWIFGGSPPADPEPVLDSDVKYNALHSAVQELVEMFDDNSKDEMHSNLTGIDLLRATKIRVRALEDEIKAERQARIRAEARISELERIKVMVEEQKREHQRLEQELQKFASLEQEYFDAEREMEQVQGEIMHMKERAECGLDYLDPATMSITELEQTIEQIEKEVHEDRGLKAQISLTVRKEIRSEMLIDQRHQEFKLRTQKLFDKE